MCIHGNENALPSDRSRLYMQSTSTYMCARAQSCLYNQLAEIRAQAPLFQNRFLLFFWQASVTSAKLSHWDKLAGIFIILAILIGPLS